ncbi:Glycosyl transferase [Hyella patelloides LEGE 07179]|uniref:Glycosyl transferase n=1 Tax=Hyella patelloides LEGE 07179 TaxID=945734 RepID=A0A563W5T1_9CYAN|nr:glycosyltransferase family A protein [Hyella patelloides]VEP18903.1 Glycosyl transferase [Hyella patelloides LEGE 07179]
MSIPKISVVVPAYNVEKYIEAALLSLESQSFKNFEALVVDDGSIDKTPEIVESFCAKDSRFKLLRKPNGGLSSARNYGIRHARGEYIALLDGDDVYNSEKLANHFAWLISSPQIGVVYSASQAIRDDGTPTFMRLSGKPIKRNPLAALLCKNFIGHGSNAVFRRCIFDEIGEFDETLRSCEDVDYWLRIAATRKWRFHREPSVQCFYRVRPSGLSFNVQEMKSNQLRVIIAACKRNPELTNHLLPTAYAYMNRYLARLCLTSGDTDSAKNYINRAWHCDHTIFLQDPRSLLTLISVRLAPLSQSVIGRTLGLVKS